MHAAVLLENVRQRTLTPADENGELRVSWEDVVAVGMERR